MDITNERRIKKQMIKTEGTTSRPLTFSGIRNKMNISTHSMKKVKRQQQQAKKEIMFRFPPTKIVKNKHQQAKKARQRQQQFQQHQRQQEAKKKLEASNLKLSKVFNNSRTQNTKSSQMKGKSMCKKQKLFISQFHNFKNLQNTAYSSQWQQILLKVSTKQQQAIRQSKSKLLQPYEKLIDKFRNLNKQNYSFENIKGINYCKNLKHQIVRTPNYSAHLFRSQSQNKINRKMKQYRQIQTIAMESTQNILDMCKQHKSTYSKIVKKNMDGFQIFCNKFANILKKKKAALISAQTQIQY